MSLPEIVPTEEWTAARVALLAREKELTRQRDALNADRRRLPMVSIDKDYTFEGERGPVRLADLFEGRRQLIVQHVMYAPEWDNACSSCTASLDEIAPGMLHHLRNRDTAFAAVSRAPYAKLARYRESRGWTFPWYSAHGSDFNYDFHVSLDESVAPVQYNYRGRDELVANGMDWLTTGPHEMPGLSCFLRDGDAVFHTYSTFGRGTEQVGGSYGWLDMTALGRQEEWEEPKGRADNPRQAVPDFSE
jgi:predicted dithiol-disulfide oxidoreductase (DUF899 family)